jgi:hypothetical protein
MITERRETNKMSPITTPGFCPEATSGLRYRKEGTQIEPHKLAELRSEFREGEVTWKLTRLHKGRS